MNSEQKAAQIPIAERKRAVETFTRVLREQTTAMSVGVILVDKVIGEGSLQKDDPETYYAFKSAAKEYVTTMETQLPLFKVAIGKLA